MKGRIAATWVLWDEPERQVAVAQWKERDVCVVFPLHWAARHGTAAMVKRAKARMHEIEGKSDRTLVPGSVLLAFSRHTLQPREHVINPDVSRGIMPQLVI